MTDPLAYGEGLGASVLILATFLGVIGLVQVAAYIRDRLQARRTPPVPDHCGPPRRHDTHRRQVVIHPIRTERGKWVAATAVPGVGVVVEEMGGSTVNRIILTREAARELAEQIDLAILATPGEPR